MIKVGSVKKRAFRLPLRYLSCTYRTNPNNMHLRKVLKWSGIVLFGALLTAPFSQAEPSLDETVGWLKAKLTGLSATNTEVIRCGSSTTQHTMTWTIKSFSVKNGALHVGRQTSTWSSDFERITGPVGQAVIRLEELYATYSVKKMAVPQPAPSRLCTNEFTQIVYELTIAARNNNGITFLIQDEELAQRVGKALVHLIKISGGKEEIF